MNFKKDKRGIAPIIIMAVVVVVIVGIIAIALNAMADQDPIYPDGMDEDNADGYITLTVRGSWFPPEPKMAEHYSVSMFGTTVSSGDPTVEVFGVELPDLLEFDSRKADVKATITYPNGANVTATMEMTMNYEGGTGGHWVGECVFPPILYFESGVYHFDMEFTMNGVTTTSAYEMHIPFSGQIVEAD